jgi:hypothetical protein
MKFFSSYRPETKFKMAPRPISGYWTDHRNLLCIPIIPKKYSINSWSFSQVRGNQNSRWPPYPEVGSHQKSKGTSPVHPHYTHPGLLGYCVTPETSDFYPRIHGRDTVSRIIQ